MTTTNIYHRIGCASAKVFAGFVRAATAGAVLLLVAFCIADANGTTFMVQVGNSGFNFDPSTVNIHVGDTVEWVWAAAGHTSTSGTPGQPNGLWDSGFLNPGATFTHTFSSAGTFPYFCTAHGQCCGMIGQVSVTASTPTPTITPTPTSTPTVTPTPSVTPSATPSGRAQNISTRVDVQAGDNVAIAGFIITGGSPTTTKQVAIRGLGGSLANLTPPLNHHLSNPILSLHEPNGTTVTNDDWMTNSTANQSIIVDQGLNMFNGKTIANQDSIIIANLTPVDPATSGSGEYTAVLSGVDAGIGVGLIEVYDLDDPTTSTTQLANISTRGLVGTGDNVLIAGVIVGPPTEGATVLVRAIGPELSNETPPIQNALADPTLELHNANGDVVATNDNWKINENGQSQQVQIEATGLAPTNDLEPAILSTLGSGGYTAIVSGKNGGTGVGVVEVYRLSE